MTRDEERLLLDAVLFAAGMLAVLATTLVPVDDKNKATIVQTVEGLRDRREKLP